MWCRVILLRLFCNTRLVFVCWICLLNWLEECFGSRKTCAFVKAEPSEGLSALYASY